MKFIIILGLTVVAFLSTAQAGDKKRNGGTLLRCGDGLEVLDLYEGKNSYGLELSPVPGKDYNDVLEQVLLRLDRLNPIRANLYRGFLKDFEKESRFIPNSNFTDIPDVGDGIPYPKECEVVQAVAQFRQVTPQGLRYLINQDLWAQLSAYQKAALTLHELVYRETYEANNNIENSQGVRYFTGYLFSTALLTDSLKSYIDTLKSSDLMTAEYRGITIAIRQDDQILETRFSDENTIRTAGLSLMYSLETSSRLQHVHCAYGQPEDRITITFNDDFSQVITSDCPMYVSLKDSQGADGYVLGKVITLKPNGKVDKILAAKSSSSTNDTYAIHYKNANSEFFGSSSNSSELRFDSRENLGLIRFKITNKQGLASTSYVYDHKGILFEMAKEYEIYAIPYEQDTKAQTH